MDKTRIELGAKHEPKKKNPQVTFFFFAKKPLKWLGD